MLSRLHYVGWTVVITAAMAGCADRSDPNTQQAFNTGGPLPSQDPPLCAFDATYSLHEHPLWGFDGTLGMKISVVPSATQSIVTYTFVPYPDNIDSQVASGEWATMVTMADPFGKTLPGADDIALFDPFVGNPVTVRTTDYAQDTLNNIYMDNFDKLEAAIPDDDDSESEEAVLPTTRPWAKMTPQMTQARTGCTLQRYDRRVENTIVAPDYNGTIGLQVEPDQFPSFGTVDWLLFQKSDGSYCKAFGGHTNDEASAQILSLTVEGQPAGACITPPPIVEEPPPITTTPDAGPTTQPMPDAGPTPDAPQPNPINTTYTQPGVQ